MLLTRVLLHDSTWYAVGHYCCCIVVVQRYYCHAAVALLCGSIDILWCISGFSTCVERSFACVVWVWCDVEWCDVVWCGVVWCGVVWCGVVCSACVVLVSCCAVLCLVSRRA